MADRNIFSWLGMREERSVINSTQEHFKKVEMAVEQLSLSLSALCKGSIEEKDEAIERLKKAEREADVLRRQVIKNLSTGLLHPPDREDLMLFVGSLDEIADWAKGTGRLLEFVSLNDLPFDLLSLLDGTGKILVNGSKCLKEAIKALGENNSKDALEKCSEVEELEEEADDRKRDALGVILKADLPPNFLLLSFEIIEGIENVADKIEDAADLIRVLAVRS